MAHKSGSDLRKEIEAAGRLVKMNDTYVHSKHPEWPYTVVGFSIIEETDSVGVLYRAEYEELRGIIFSRPLESFLSEVELPGGIVKRFSLREAS